jgi:hypothetical protein
MKSRIYCLFKIIALFLILAMGSTQAANKQGKAQRRGGRNLPDVDVTESGHVSVAEEINVLSIGGISNTSIEYGHSSDWNIALNLINAQFFSTTNVNFAPDLLFGVEKNWLLKQGRLIIGSQNGIGFLSNSQVFLTQSYVDYQCQFKYLDIDIGGYYANAALANKDSVGFHLNIEFPLGKYMRLNADYLSGNNSIGGFTAKALFPLNKTLTMAFGLQLPNQYSTDRYIGLIGLYWVH